MDLEKVKLVAVFNYQHIRIRVEANNTQYSIIVNGPGTHSESITYSSPDDYVHNFNRALKEMFEQFPKAGLVLAETNIPQIRCGISWAMIYMIQNHVNDEPTNTVPIINIKKAFNYE